jgi:hypothetical protein
MDASSRVRARGDSLWIGFGKRWLHLLQISEMNHGAKKCKVDSGV